MKKYFIIIMIFSLLLGRVIYLNIYNKDNYVKKLENKTINYVEGASAPRGRIIDRNGKILVDNTGIKTVFYTKLKDISLKDELNIARKLASIINI